MVKKGSVSIPWKSSSKRVRREWMGASIVLRMGCKKQARSLDLISWHIKRFVS
jgi:hypothetical protein